MDRSAGNDIVKNQAVAVQAIALSAARGVGQVIMVLAIAGVARNVGVERLGMLVTSLALAAVLSGLFDFGANSYWVRELAAGRMSDATYSARSGTKLALGLTLSVIAGVMALVLFPGQSFWGVGPLLMSSLLSQTAQSLMLARGRPSRLILAALVDRGVLGVGVVALTLWTSIEPEPAFIVSYTLGSALGAIVCYSSISHSLLPRANAKSLSNIWEGSRYYGMSSAFVALQSLDIVIAGGVGGPSVSGTYGAVNRWTAPITLVTSAVAALQAPAIASARSKAEVWSRLRPTLWLSGGAGLAAIVMAMLAQPLVLVLLGAEFIAASDVLRVAALAAAVSAATQTLMTVLQARRRDRYVALAFASVVATQLALVVPLTAWHGALGTATASVIAQLMLFVALGVGLFRATGRIELRGPAARSRQRMTDDRFVE